MPAVPMLHGYQKQVLAGLQHSGVQTPETVPVGVLASMLAGVSQAQGGRFVRYKPLDPAMTPQALPAMEVPTPQLLAKVEDRRSSSSSSSSRSRSREPRESRERWSLFRSSSFCGRHVGANLCSQLRTCLNPVWRSAGSQKAPKAWICSEHGRALRGHQKVKADEEGKGSGRGAPWRKENGSIALLEHTG
eukprot:s3839_g7.t11